MVNATSFPCSFKSLRMLLHTEHVLQDSIDQALANGYRMLDRFFLVDVGGYFMPPPRSKGRPITACHPLETIILGEPITDCVNMQICEYLSVGPHWVQGFMDGYKFKGKCFDGDYYDLRKGTICRMRYIEGYADGCEIKDWIIDLKG